MNSKKTPAAACIALCLLQIALLKSQENQPAKDTTAQLLPVKINFSGYIQAQFQIADSAGALSYAGGNFGTYTDKRFMIRRGRLKAVYSGKSSSCALQTDVSEKGIAIKEAYAKISEPWINCFSLTAGIVDRPFGFEAGYSSASRETPEHGRVSQIIFPGETDLGAMISIQAPSSSAWRFLKADAGLFNGTGGSASDFDHKKDFISRVRIEKEISAKLKFGFGLSYYGGGWRQVTSSVYTMYRDSSGLASFLQNHDTANYGAIARRQYAGADFQISLDWKAGITTCRAEYISGNQPGTSFTSASASLQPLSDTYLREFNGAYFYFIQNIFKTKHQIVIKYDWYDPNKKVKGNDISKPVSEHDGKNFESTSKQDLKFSTLGIGWNYQWDQCLKFMLYYDIVRNEISRYVGGYTTDLRDNVLTVRMQCKF